MNYKKFLGAASAALMIVIVILMLAPGAWAQSKYKTLYKFKGGKNGNGAFAGLIFDSAGNLYGTTVYGGAHDAGTVFELTPTSTGGWTQNVLYSFNCSDGCNPQLRASSLMGLETSTARCPRRRIRVWCGL